MLDGRPKKRDDGDEDGRRWGATEERVLTRQSREMDKSMYPPRKDAGRE
jgi:hypothetical protein